MRCTVLATLLCTPVVFAADPTPLAWPTPTAEQKPWTRWWWLGSAVDEAGITKHLERFRDAGFGGVEICPIYGAKGSEDKYIDFLSPKWLRMLAHTTAEAKRLGLGVDMTTGTGWPFGGPTVTADDASARVVLKRYELAGGATLAEKLPTGKLRALRAVAADGTTHDLTERMKDGKLDWTAPAGAWKLYAVVQQSPVMKVKRAAPGGVGNVLDPFSTAKLDRYLSVFDKAFADYKGLRPRAQFHDSYEYYNAQWTDDLFAEFAVRRGYDLRNHLPALFGDGDQDKVGRVKHDYRETISDLHIAYIKRWTEWAHARGELTRNQAHGGPTNLLDAYAAADIPEMEVYRSATESQMPMMKVAASAAHTSGKNLVSAEAFTWLGEHFNTSLAQIKPAADNLFLAGVNHLVYHGTPYSPEGVDWPGWQFYAAVNFAPGGGLGRDLPAFNAYVARVQSVLQAGKPSNDVLLYLPVHDKWQDARGLMMPFETEGRWMESLPFHETAMTLWKRGYGFDCVSDRGLENARYERQNFLGILNAYGRETVDKIVLGENRYRAIVVPKCRTMPPTTLRALAKLAREGAKVVVIDSIPADVPGFGDLTNRRRDLADAAREFQVEVDGGIRCVSVGNDVEKLLVATGVGRGSMPSSGLHFVRRFHNAWYDYFIVNQNTKPVDEWVSLGTDVVAAALFDPSSGRAATMATVSDRDDAKAVYLQLQPGQSCVLRAFFDNNDRDIQRVIIADMAAGKSRHYRTTQEPVAVAGPWKVQFIDGGPVLPAAYETADLASWTTRDDAEAKRFAGTARYTLDFDRPAAPADDWLLDLGRVAESARVSVNGKPVGTLFAAPFRVSIGEHLRPGKNTLEVEVTNLAANRVRDLDRRKVNWKYFHDANVSPHPGSRQRGVLDASQWPIRDSGLLGPVRLVPVKWFSP